MLYLIISLLVVSGIIMLFLGVNASQKHDTKAAIAFSLTMFSASLWAFGFAAEILSTTLEGKIFWANIQFLGINVLPLSWFAMTLYYTGQPRWTVRSLPSLSLLPIAITVFIWSDPWHHLFRGSPSLEFVNSSFSILRNDYGIFFYAVSVPFGYFLFGTSLFLLARFWFKSAPIYRRQRLIPFISLLLPLLVDALYVLGITPIPNFNFTPVTFSISGLLVGWNIFSLHFLDITPLANDAVINTMGVGVIVLDKYGCIIDINPAAEKITGTSSLENVGVQAAEIFPDYASFLDSNTDEEVEIELERDGEKEFYHAQTSRIFGKRKELRGRVITLNNISERVILYQQVKKASLTDPLTGVQNRRAFIEKGKLEIARALRHERKLSVIMMDIDDFKTINDQYGHGAGDKALVITAQLCRQQMRSTDFIARYGGDEFVVFLPETSKKEAYALGKRICEDIAQVILSSDEGENYYLSVSVGVAEFNGEETLRVLLHRADKALYEAKRAGKNRVV